MNFIDQAVEDADKIQGWMNKAELYWLAVQASFRTRIVEFGSWLGRSTYVLAALTKGSVYAVDTWTGMIEGKLVDAECERKFKANTKDWDHAIVPLKMKTTQAAVALCGLNPDMVFIDADHSYEAVKKDIENGLKLLRPNGILCGHDYSSDYPGVTRAVYELLNGEAQKLDGGDIWYWEKP